MRLKPFSRCSDCQLEHSLAPVGGAGSPRGCDRSYNNFGINQSLWIFGCVARIRNKRLNCGCIPIFRQQEINSIAFSVNGTVQVSPVTFDLNVRFIHSPRIVDLSKMFMTALIQLWRVIYRTHLGSFQAFASLLSISRTKQRLSLVVA